MFTDDLRTMFSYDPETGVITRLVRQGNHAAGTPCTSKATGGYLKVTANKRVFSQHRLAWFLYYGEQPPEQIDHRNLNKADNHISNLRVTDNSTNQMNIPVHERSQTGIKGIMPVRGGKLYRAEVCVNGKRYQKHSKSIQVLEAWVVDKRNELHKEFARHA